ncbi:MAG TPA: hypothetical protein VLD18_14465 [Verrucomicrobiae bacterium]|nr:hypothetical protein [Verrucomicrobiae bacterium]
MARLLLPPGFQVVDSTGEPVSGAKVYFYATGTTTDKTVYQNEGLSTPHTQPVVADSAGVVAAVYGTEADDYKVVFETSADVEIRTVDPLPNLAVTAAMIAATRGDLLQGNASSVFEALAVGTANQLLTTDGTDVSWSTLAAAMVPDNLITLAMMAHQTQGGILLYGASGAPGVLNIGTAGQFLAVNSGATALEYVTRVWPNTIHVQDQKAAGTDGGGFTSGAWRTRDLNTALTNEITGASLATNQITLPAGTYEARGSAPASRCDLHKTKLVDVTNTADLIIGQAAQSNSSTAFVTHSHFAGRFTLAGTAAIEVQHQCQTTRATDGLGIAAGFSEVEVYTDILIHKIA